MHTLNNQKEELLKISFMQSIIMNIITNRRTEFYEVWLFSRFISNKQIGKYIYIFYSWFYTSRMHIEHLQTEINKM